MADVSTKEQKLAAARKKLKKFQKKKDLQKVSKNGKSSPYLEALVYQRSEASSSRSSSVTDVSESGSTRQDHTAESITNSLLIPPVENLSIDHSGVRLNATENNSDAKTNSHNAEVPYELSAENSTNASSTNNQTFMVTEADISHSSPDDKDVPNDIVTEINRPIVEKNCDKIDILENEGSVCSETNASVTTVLQVKNLDSNQDPSVNVPLRSTAESLRQLSLQMSGLIDHSGVQDPIEHEETIKELEKRNGELASLLEQERQKTLEDNSLIAEMKATIASQNAQIETLQKMTVTENNGSEMHGMREQLQVHIQTIGILVAEKSELQSSLSHTRYSLEQKAGEVSELQGRLEASREHVRRLEATNEHLKDEISALSDSKANECQQTESLRSNNAKLSKLCEEMRASTAELTERLAVRSEENQKLNAELTDIRRQYELSQVHIEQLRSNSTEDLKKQLEQLQVAYNDSQTQVRMFQAAVETAQNEKQQLDYEYKSYTNQLVADMEQLKQKLESECKKREEYEAREKALEADLKSREADSKSKISLDEVVEERNRLQQAVADMTQERRIIDEKCSYLARDNGQLSQLLAEQSAKLEALETAVDRHSTEEVDTTQLLKTMQSDKIAAARALSQNKQLKEQLEELQNGFIMMSNKKLELTEKLEKELHIKKNLYQEISKLSEDLASHKEILLVKQRELDAMKTGSVTSTHRHVVTETAREAIEACTDHVVNGNHSCDDGHHVHHSQMQQRCTMPHSHEYLNSSTDPRSPVVACAEERVGSVCKENSKTEQPNSMTQELAEKENDSEPVRVSSNEAHEALEKRFLQCMKDLAAVSDEKQSLEHLVQQLQLETETIGDYITIYQFQRGVMKQQMNELQSELELLKTEKQEIVCKLSKLQKLVENLANDEDGLKEGFIHGISSIIKSSSSTNTHDNRNVPEDREEEVSQTAIPEGGEVEPIIPVHSKENSTTTDSNSTRTNTVRQIMDLISEMETTTQLDVSALHKFHPCSQCSGRLITI